MGNACGVTLRSKYFIASFRGSAAGAHGCPPPAEELTANVLDLDHRTPRLHDHYTLGRKLGQGQFGTTYLCTHHATGVTHACKSIAKWKLITMEHVEGVRREIQIMRHLAMAMAGHRHRNIVAIKGAYEDQKHVHIVMELCAGGSLFDRIKQHGHYGERKAAELARIIVGLVDACHSLGVMHRDLKPENFLFANKDDDMSLKVIDFGFSVFFKPGQTFTDIVGSPYYVAPEVLHKQHGPEADVWAAGVILYILLSGVPPFWAETEQGIFKAILKGVIDFDSDPWPVISESAKDLIRRMLNPLPSERLTAHEVLCHPWICDDNGGPWAAALGEAQHTTTSTRLNVQGTSQRAPAPQGIAMGDRYVADGESLWQVPLIGQSAKAFYADYRPQQSSTLVKDCFA